MVHVKIQSSLFDVVVPDLILGASDDQYKVQRHLVKPRKTLETSRAPSIRSVATWKSIRL